MPNENPNPNKNADFTPDRTEWDDLSAPEDQPQAPESNPENSEILENLNREILNSEQKLQALDVVDSMATENQAPVPTSPESASTSELDQINLEMTNIEQKLQALDAFSPESLSQIEQEEAEINQKLAALDALDSPLVAINADFTTDKKELASDYAERELNAEIAKSKGLKGLVDRIWKGNLFKKYYQKRYEREIYEDKRSVEHDGKRSTLGDIIENRSDSAMKRFVMGATDEYSQLIHTEAGESRTEADARTTEIVKNAIEEYASAELAEGETLEDLRINFGNNLARLKAEERDNGTPLNENMINNYFNVAVQARQRAAHGLSMDKVMEGFKVYNVDVRNNIRTDTHRDNLDKITNFLETSKIGQFIPPEAIAAAVGVAYSLTQTGARALAGAGLGLGVSAAFAGLRERNRVAEDRARMLRDVAAGGEYNGLNGEEPKGHVAKNRSRYEARIGGTLYDLRPASDLINALEESLKSDNLDFRRNAIAEARVRISLSDSEQKDLISYSSEDKIGDERLRLDIALIKAEKSLPKDDISVNLMKETIKENILEDIEQKDQAFKVDRTKLAFKAAAKTAAVGTAFFFGSQEAMAAISPDKLGLFEKAGLLKTDNSKNAKETILAGLSGSREYTKTITGISGSDKAAIAKYKDAGFKQTEIKPSWEQTKTDLVEIDPANSDHKLRTIYDGWANNGTRAADGNELGAYLENGTFRANLSGTSSFNGQSLNINDLAAAGKIKGYLTVGGAKFEIQGQMGENGFSWGENGVFTTTTGETIKAIGDNGEKLYKYFEVAVDNGVDTGGYTHIVPLATEVGSDTFSGKLQEVTETVVSHPATYNFTKTFSRSVYTSGVVLPGVSSRTGLGEASMV